MSTGILLVIVLPIVVIALAVFLFFTSAGLELREGRPAVVGRPSPQHTRVENEGTERGVIAGPIAAGAVVTVRGAIASP